MRFRSMILIAFITSAMFAVGLGGPASALTDETNSLQAMFNGAKSGQTIRLQPRTYSHAGILRISVPGVTVDGNGATLRATNESTSALQITGSGVSVRNLTLSNAANTRRWTSMDQHALVVNGTSGVQLSQISVNGSAAAGIFVTNSSNFTINSPRVSNTRADGIHLTGGSNNGQVNNPVTTQTGDDGVAVVSYLDAPICHDIRVSSPTVNGTTGGRGISVVGGQRITYTNVAIRDTNAAGIYVAAEPSYSIRSVDAVAISGGTVTHANTNPSVVNGAVLVYNGRSDQSVTGVTISGVRIASTPTSAGRAVGVLRDRGVVSGVVLSRIAIDSATPTPFVTNAPGTYRTDNWTVAGAPYAVR